jgi:hypothetical protein
MWESEVLERRGLKGYCREKKKSEKKERKRKKENEKEKERAAYLALTVPVGRYIAVKLKVGEVRPIPCPAELIYRLLV